MKINVFGLGYVGIVSAACMVKNGNEVTGVDIDETKVRIINNGKSPIVEPGLQELIENAYHSKKLRATVNDINDIEDSDISIVCVGTPSNENGSLKLDYIFKIAEQIGNYLYKINDYHIVNFRSTVLPGTIEEKVIPIIERRSNKKAGLNFGVCMNPEFLREGSSIYDFFHPPFTVIGQLDERSGSVVAKLYDGIKAPLIRTEIKVAEMLKYTCNSFHALKVAFANEIGNICKSLNIDSHEVMNIFCKDTKLNLSPYYLKPGFAFGGSCLPKDLRAILYKAKEMDLKTPILSSILPSNAHQIETAFHLVKKTGKNKVGVLGLSFKPGTDDLRESPIVELVEKLIGKGYKISIYDKEVSMAKIFGSNKKYIEHAIPHISSLMKDSPLKVIENSEVIVLGNKTKEAEEIISRINGNKVVVDLVKVISNSKEMGRHYEGICW